MKLFTPSLAMVLALAVCTSTFALPVRQDHCDIGKSLHLPVYCWSDAGTPLQAVVVAVHGVVMHGGSFHALGTHLAQCGYLVFAPDLRGYGRWQTDSEYASDKARLDYSRSLQDLELLVEQVRSNYPRLPVYMIGESLGADLAIRIAADHPDWLDGLILSSPALKHRTFISTRSVAEVACVITNPMRKIQLASFIRSYASHDPRICQEIIDDPLVRKQMTTAELWRSHKQMRATMDYIKKVPPHLPVLVIQGSADRTIKANAVVLLLSRLRSKDQTVRWFPSVGHILLETSYLQPSTVDVIDSWLIQHVQNSDRAWLYPEVDRQVHGQIEQRNDL